ncbi:MAG: 16S rRNA (cytosine(1402)-N(4))-methyltransferase RsmH [Sphingobacteriaceae bacterium]|nr:16S rRNA (cytosine(1402)-N(4))-methyltransferase RsmH [Sphingobacteriaceae bacterium]
MTEQAYHLPVMLSECLDGLAINPNGTYVDVTFGGGGHSQAILERLGPNGRLIAFDQDPDVQAHLPQDERFIFVDANFRYLKRFLRLNGALPVDGILADLGVSSHQFDEAERGFSFRFDAQLDMRMDTRTEKSAWHLVNEYDEQQLKHILRLYGELTNPGRVAKLIVLARTRGPLDTIEQLKQAVAPAMGADKPAKFYAKIFQAIRIELNEEMAALEAFLLQCAEVLKPQGRLVVMSYHSLEDRLVKHLIKQGNLEGKIEKDFYGNDIRDFDPLNGRAIIATEAEQALNPRSRSAKLRIGVRRS